MWYRGHVWGIKSCPIFAKNEKLLKKDTFCRSIRVLFSTVIFAEHSLAIPSKKAARYGAAFIFASRKTHFTGNSFPAQITS